MKTEIVRLPVPQLFETLPQNPLRSNTLFCARATVTNTLAETALFQDKKPKKLDVVIQQIHSYFKRLLAIYVFQTEQLNET